MKNFKVGDRIMFSAPNEGYSFDHEEFIPGTVVAIDPNYRSVRIKSKAYDTKHGGRAGEVGLEQWWYNIDKIIIQEKSNNFNELYNKLNDNPV